MTFVNIKIQLLITPPSLNNGSKWKFWKSKKKLRHYFDFKCNKKICPFHGIYNSLTYNHLNLALSSIHPFSFPQQFKIVYILILCFVSFLMSVFLFLQLFYFFFSLQSQFALQDHNINILYKSTG